MNVSDFNKQPQNIIVWLLLLAMPFWMPYVGGYVQLGTQVVVLGLAAMALNFLLGYTGVLSFGHAAYFGLGAYGAAMTIRYLEPSTGLGIVVGVVVGTIAAAIIGPLIIRLRGVYFAMVTIAFGQVFYFIAFRWNTVTGGDDGLTGWTRQPLHLGFTTIDIQSNADAFYYFVLVLFGIAAAVMAWLLRSPFGRTLIAIRENERRARFLGIPVDQHIWMSWVISCCFVSLAGALYALLNNFVDPRALYWTQSGDFVIMAVLGGMRSFWGPLIGAAIYVVLRDYLSSMTENWEIVHRPVLRAGRVVLPARCSRHNPPKGCTMSLLRVENVSKHFGSLIAVNDVSMTVEPGELRAIIGPNGAGKTTFFNMISGFLTQSSGKIIFADEDISSLLPARRVWRGIARTFQITEVFPELSVRENLRTAVEVAAGYRLSPWLAKDGDGEIRARVTDLLDMSGLAEKADRLVGELAHGDQRATEIMMALALKPRLLLLDEPTAGMGDQETYDITRLIRKLHRDQKLTIVLIEHDMRVVFHLADRIMVLAEGKMLAEGTPQDIAANEAVQAAYLGKAA